MKYKVPSRWPKHRFRSDNFVIAVAMGVCASDNFVIAVAMGVCASDNFIIAVAMRVCASDNFIIAVAIAVLRNKQSTFYSLQVDLARFSNHGSQLRKHH